MTNAVDGFISGLFFALSVVTFASSNLPVIFPVAFLIVSAVHFSAAAETKK